MAEEKSPNVFLFHGEDNYSSLEKLNHWKKAFIEKYGEEANPEVIEAQKLDISDFITNLDSLPFLAEKKMVILKDPFRHLNPDQQKQVADNLEDVPDFCVLILLENGPADKRTSLYKKVQKVGQINEFPPLTPEKTTSWIRETAQKESISISPATATFLANHCGPDLWTISNELKKLKTYAQGAEITPQMVEELCHPSITASIFKLTDAIANRNRKESLKVFRRLVESGEDPIKTFFMIVRHFRIIIQVAELLSKKENSFNIAKKLKQHPYVVQTTAKQAPNFSDQQLRQIYQQLLEIDIKTKTGKIRTTSSDHKEFELEIEKFILSCCAK